MQYLHAENLYESQEEALVREEVLGMLEQLVKNWIKGVRRLQTETTLGENLKTQRRPRWCSE